MGWKFRRSIKILPGVRLNFNKNSTSVSIGGKHAGITINPKTGTTMRVSFPGTGVTYTEKVKKKNRKIAESTASKPQTQSVKQIHQEPEERIAPQIIDISDANLNVTAFKYSDELLPASFEVCVRAGSVSVSLLQRSLHLGYARAARIIDEMEELGLVGPFQGSKPRALLITESQWESMKQPPQE